MDRRDLVGLAATVGLGGLAGCLGSISDESGAGSGERSTSADEQSTADTETNGSRSNDDTSDLEVSDAGPIEQVETVDVDEIDGREPSGVHAIWIENATGEERHLSVRVDRDDEPVLEGTKTVSADTALEVVVGDPGTYETTIESGGIRSTTTITRSETSCDESRTIVSFDGGGIETSTKTTC